MFVIKEISGELIKDATEDEISDYKEVDIKALSELEKTLKSIDGGWHDWATFRSELISFYINN